MSIDRIAITPHGVQTVKAHLGRFDGDDAANDMMLRRLDEIAVGDLTPTATDKRFYAHELRESVRYRKIGWALGELPVGDDPLFVWNDLHTAALEDYRLREGVDVLYVSEPQVGR